MPSEDTPRKKVLDAALKSALSTLDLPAWIKAPATFVAELSARFRNLPARQRNSVKGASDEDIRDALLQLDLATKHAAFAAAGVCRVEDQVAALRTAIEDANGPNAIKFPRAIEQEVFGNGNFVVGKGSIHVENVDMRSTTRRRRSPVIPGTVATDPYKVGYLEYLVGRFNQFKESEVGKPAMKYALIRIAYKREIKFNVAHTPLERFDEAVAYLQGRIRNTMIGRAKAAEGNRLFESFAEFVAGRRKAR